jgi:ABC-type glutathione transport system ATPase component
MNPKLQRLLAQRDHLQRSIEEERSRKEQQETKLSNLLTVQNLFQEAAEAVQQTAHAQVASVVTRCLQAVFGKYQPLKNDQGLGYGYGYGEGSYEFQIEFSQKRGKTEAELLLVKNGHKINPPEECGGGVTDVLAFALRLACLMLSRPRKRKFLTLDEPFKHLSADYRESVRELLETLSEEMGIQILMVTHTDELQVGKVILMGET